MTIHKTVSNKLLLGISVATLLLLPAPSHSPGEATRTGESPKPIAFVNVNVVPMDTERVLENHTVIIRGDRITELGPRDVVTVPPGAHVIEGKGSYLIPGLADMHVHLRNSPAPRPMLDPDPNHLRLYLAHGVTTVRNMAGSRTVLDWKAHVVRGELLGPTIYTSGPIIGGVAPEARRAVLVFRIVLMSLPILAGGVVFLLAWIVFRFSGRQERSKQLKRLVLPMFGLLAGVGMWLGWFKTIPIGGWAADTFLDATYVPVGTPAEAWRAVARQKAAGYDFIKVYDYVNGETYAAVLAAAKSYNLYVAGHIPEVVPSQTLFTSGQAEIVHIDEYLTYHRVGYHPNLEAPLFDAVAAEYQLDDSKILQIVAATKAHNVVVGTTLVVVEVLYRLQEDLSLLNSAEYTSVRPAILHTWKTQGRLVDWKGHEHYIHYTIQPFLLRLTKALHDAGVALLAGTDVAVEGILPGYSLHRELEILVEADLTPFEALATSTRNAAQVTARMNGQGDWGTITVGNRADKRRCKRWLINSLRRIPRVRITRDGEGRLIG